MSETAIAADAEHTRAPLLERDTELAELEHRVNAAASGHGAVVVVEGPAGVGKSRLLARGVEIARDAGFDALAARGGQLERSFGLGIARQLFEQRVRSLPARARGRALDGAAARAAPLLGAEAAGEDAGPATAPDPEFAVIHGLYWLAANLAAEAPLVVAIDDAHWADHASLRFLAYLARRIGDLPLLALVAVRSGEPDAPSDLLQALVDDGVVLRPRPLSLEATGELVTTALGQEPAEAFVATCHEATGGNPFLISSVLATLRQDGVEPTAPSTDRLREASVDAVSAAVATRLRSLPGPAAQLAEGVAVLGNNVELHEAARLSGIDDAEASAAADALAVAAILAPARPLEFVHPLVRAAVYEQMPLGRRAAAHGQAAQQLAAEGADPERIAVQLLAAEPGAVPGTVETLRIAADRALGRGAPETAADYIQRALREPVSALERGVLLRELGSIVLRRGDPAALDHLEKALELTPRGPQRANVARELSLGLVPMGRYEDAIAVLERASSELEDAEPELSFLIESEIGTEAMLKGELLPVAIDRLLPLLPQVTAAATPGERAVLATIAIVEAAGEAPADQVSEHALPAVDGGLLTDQGPDAHVVYNGPYPLVLADRYEPAWRALDALLDESRRRGSLLGVARVSAFRSNLAYREGALADAEAEARASIEAATPAWIVSQLSSGWLIEALIERGELDQARSELERAGLDGDLDDILMHNFPLASRARLRLALGEAEAALADLRELDRREGRGRGRNPAWFGHRALMTEALLRLGETDEAARLAAEELELARRWGAPRAIGSALRAVGITLSGERRFEALREAADVLDGSEARLEHARTLVDLGASLRRKGNRRECREPLTQGMELAHRCGAVPLAERAREELVATGARPRRMVRSGVDALTPSELRVARMAAEGMTNREIAQALFVTLRTVEVHLTHSYQKLNISSREELPSALAD